MNESELMQEARGGTVIVALLMAVFYGCLIGGVIGYLIGASV